MLQKLLNLTLLTMTMMTAAQAKLVTQNVDYTDEKGTLLEGYMAYDDAKTGPRPGVLVAADWRGISEVTRERVDMLAALGYVGFAADVYGKGVHPEGVPAYVQEMMKYKGNRPLYRLRLRAALAEMRKHSQVDPTKVAAIGFCFGGTGVMELARDGADVLGVVTFHGGLDSPTPADGKNIKCKVLCLCGADDPFEKPEDQAAFDAEMKDNGIDYQIVQYGHAVHSFTDKTADALHLDGAKYNAKADVRSWRAMQDFFTEIFS